MNNREHRTISISEQIFEKLEYDILSGKYKKGEVLSELRLSQELGVSRTPIREAIIALCQEHVLEDTGKGIVVVSITKQEVMDMYDIRLRLEGEAASRAAQCMSEEALEELTEAVELQGFYIEKQKNSDKDLSVNIKDLDSRFHGLIYENCGSRPYGDVLLALHKKINKYRKASVTRKSRAEKSYEEHLGILNAIRARDAGEAGRLMTEHIMNARSSILEIEEV